MGFFPEPAPLDDQHRHSVGLSVADPDEESGADWVMSFGEGDADFGGEGGDEDAHEPSWGPDESMMPGAVAETLVLGRSESGAAFLSAIRSYPDGVLMILEARAAPDAADLSHLDDPWREPDATALRFGFEFADGRRATSVDGFAAEAADDEQLAALVAHGGSSTHRSTETEFWLTPLPPPGPLILGFEWQERGIAFRTEQLDAELFREAAGRAAPLWPGPESVPV